VQGDFSEELAVLITAKFGIAEDCINLVDRAKEPKGESK
jgi:hypothetical protein